MELHKRFEILMQQSHCSGYLSSRRHKPRALCPTAYYFLGNFKNLDSNIVRKASIHVMPCSCTAQRSNWSSGIFWILSTCGSRQTRFGSLSRQATQRSLWTNTAKCTFLELTSVWILCGVDTSAIKPSAVGSPFGLNLYRQSVDSHRQEGKLKFNSQINGFAIDNFKAKKMTGFTWSEFCSALPYKAPCKHCVNLLEIAGQNPSSFCCFPTELVAQTISSRTVQATNGESQITNTSPASVEGSRVTWARSSEPKLNISKSRSEDKRF